MFVCLFVVSLFVCLLLVCLFVCLLLVCLFVSLLFLEFPLLLQELISPATLVTLPGGVSLMITLKNESSHVSRLAEVRV